VLTIKIYNDQELQDVSEETVGKKNAIRTTSTNCKRYKNHQAKKVGVPP